MLHLTERVKLISIGTDHNSTYVVDIGLLIEDVVSKQICMFHFIYYFWYICL